MDRRFALAVVLSFLVLMVFQVWFAPEPPEQTAPAGSGDTTGVEPSPVRMDPTPADVGDRSTREPDPLMSTREPDPLMSAPPDTGVQAPPRVEVLEVEGERFSATFTSLGGKLTSWELKDYVTPSGVPVQMLNGQSEVGLVVETDRGLVALDEVPWNVRQEPVANGTRIVFQTGFGNGLQVVKTYTVPREGYLVDLDVDIRGAADASGYRVTWNHGIPPAEESEKQYKNSVASQVMVGNGVEKARPGDFKREAEKLIQGNVRWAGVRNKYFMASLVPPPETSSLVITTGDNERNITGFQLVMPVLRGEARHAYKLYLGPSDFGRLKELGLGLERGVDLGWNIFRPISKLLLAVMVWMYGFIPNYGVVIIIISSLTKVIFYPLTKSSIRSMKAMQMIQPEAKEIREKYKSDPKRMQKETMELYKRNKVNPLGGCFPMLLQMPVFIALYAVLSNSITMRQADFMLWINDLSIPDTLFSVGGFPLHILPIVMFLTTVAQQLLTPMTDPRQKIMGYMMPFVMLFIFYSFPAGLNLYWTVNNALTVAQQWKIHRDIPHPVSPPAPEETGEPRKVEVKKTPAKKVGGKKSGGKKAKK